MQRTPEQWREYRAARKAADRPVPRGGPTRRKLDYREWLCIDSEGADAGGRHVMTHLVVHHSSGETYTLARDQGIDAAAAIIHLLNAHARHPKAISVWFAGGYDATMLLKRLLTPDKLQELWQRTQLRHPDGKAVTWLGRFGVNYQPGKRLWLFDSRTRRSIVIWDVFGFWQCSFVRALEEWLPDHPHLALIRDGKARRGAFGPAESQFVGRYCQAECAALADLMGELARRLETAGVRVNRWDGAGAIAAALLKSHQVDQHMAPTDPDMIDPVRRAFFGGRIELLQYGQHPGEVHHYDINSAYPAACVELPSMAGGEWVPWVGPGIPQSAWSRMGMVHIRWALKGKGHELYPFPFRYSNGHICYPAVGEGWYWWPEYAAYMAHVGAYEGTIQVAGGVYWVPRSEAKPFGWVQEIYDLRAQWVREDNPGQIILKKGLAALYGKLAQQVGSEPGKAPRWHQLEWAGWITSSTRARMYRVAMDRPAAIIQLATDGIYATEPLGVHLQQGKPLGGWSYAVHTGILAVQSGVYWVWDDERMTTHTRGFKQENMAADERLTPANVLRAWQEQAGNVLASLEVVCKRRFVTFGLVAIGKHPFAELGTWQPNPKTLALYPRTKRLPMPGRSPTPWANLERTRAEPNQFEGHMSAPHRLAWWPGEEVYREQLSARRVLRAEA